MDETGAARVDSAWPTNDRSLPEPRRLVLGFPRRWEVALSPFAFEMERRAEGWLRQRGIIRDAATAEKFAKLAVAEYANWPFSRAEEDEAEVITKFLALWIFYDDLIEESDLGEGGALFDAIAGSLDDRPHASVYLACWSELGRACAAKMSASWRQRHATRFVDWARSVREESAHAELFRRTGASPSTFEHLARRSANIGMLPNIDFIEYQSGRELSAATHGHPAMQELVALASEAVAIMNDVFGYAKDEQARWPNLIRCLRDERGLPLAGALREAVSMHDARVAAMDRAAEHLIADSREPIAVSGWIQDLRHVVYGFARWHATAPRYASVFDVGEGRRLVIGVGAR